MRLEGRLGIQEIAQWWLPALFRKFEADFKQACLGSSSSCSEVRAIGNLTIIDHRSSLLIAPNLQRSVRQSTLTPGTETQHTEGSLPSFVPTTLSKSPLHLTHTLQPAKYLCKNIPSMFSTFPTFQIPWSHLPPANHFPSSIQSFSIPFCSEHANSPRPHFSKQKLRRYAPKPLRTSLQTQCSTAYSVKAGVGVEAAPCGGGGG